MRRIPAMLSLVVLGLLTACGGGNDGGPKQDITVSVGPKTAQQFTAVVKGTTNTAITWTTAGPGTLSTGGLYTAPATQTTPKTVTVTATSQADNTKSGTATITIPAVTISVPSNTASVILGASQQFNAAVTNATNTAVNWYLSGPGTLSSSGLYSAPATLNTPSTATVQAVSQADPNKVVSVTVTIPVVTVGISPQNPTVSLGATQQFTATVGSAINTAVTWSVTGVGTVSNAGLYTTPATLTTPASATVIATSVTDPSKSASTTITIPAVGVTVAPSAKNLDGGESQTFTATVTRASNTSVTWSLAGLGTLGTNGAYTAPTVVPSQQTATITATSVADPSKSGSAVVTLKPISVTVSPLTATVPINTTQPFTATVSGTSNQLLTWSVSGTGCSGDDCGQINSSGLYAAPDSVPNPATVTVKATSSIDSTKSGTAVVTVTDNANSKLNGSFAFMFQGFYGSNLTAMIGSFTADGKGILTNGRRDLNSTSGAQPISTTFSGTYQLHGDNRGTMTFDTLPGSPSFRFGLSSTDDKGYMVEIDSTGTTGGGMFRKQTTTDFTISKITGDYAFGLSGNSYDGGRDAAVGYMHTDGVGTIANGWINSSAPYSTSLSGNFTFGTATGSANGRGTMSISAPNLGNFTAGFYMVSADSFFFMLEDQVRIDYPLLFGEVQRQAGRPYSGQLSGGHTFYMNGLSQTMGTSLALIGQFGATGTSGSGEFARSDGGVPTAQQAFNVSISGYSASVGRYDLTSAILGQMYLYLTDTNSGFLLAPSGAALGKVEAQVLPAGGLKLTDLPGRYFNRNAEIVLPSTGAFSATTNLEGTGSWTGFVDVSTPLGSVTDQPNAGQLTLISGTTGRITNTMVGDTAPIIFSMPLRPTNCSFSTVIPPTLTRGLSGRPPVTGRSNAALITRLLRSPP